MKILNKQILCECQGNKIVNMKIECPHIAKKAKPGQFVSLMVSENGERIPLTIVDHDNNSIDVIFQVLGLSTQLLEKLEVGDNLYAIVGPLGKATHIEKFGNVILVAGGVGIAEIDPVAKAFKEIGNYVEIVIGTKNKELLFSDKELGEIADKLFICTDDGSIGEKCFTTDILEKQLKLKKYDLVYTVGPIVMMEKVVSITKSSKIKTMVSLNSLMLDGTGMCGCCRVSISGKPKFTCIDGPEFDGFEVNWQELKKRNDMYCDKENHVCKLRG
ncbi:sulfide/dihydroorotate dehydrogenase-like FAD/NAD-binding protein [bacterium]